MGAAQFKSHLGLFLFLCIQSAFCITNGAEDTETLSVVKLTNRQENALCSGTIIGTNPVTVMTAFHCANLDLNGGIYLDLRLPPKDAEALSKIASIINPPKQVDLSIFKGLNPIDLGNGLKIDPSNIPENGVITFGGPLEIPPPPLQEAWRATKFILSPSQTESKSFKEYEEKLNQKILVESELSRTVQKIAHLQLSAESNKDKLSFVLTDLSFVAQKSPELIALEAKQLKLTEELMYLSRITDRKRAAIIGNEIGNQKATDVVILVFENYKMEGNIQDLYSQKKFTPVLADMSQLADSDEEFTLHGYGKDSIFSEGSIKKAERKKTTALNVALEDNEDKGFLKFRGLLKNIASEKFPLGTYGSMIDGDSGGSIQKDGALVGVYSQYRLGELEGEELVTDWPHFHKNVGDSEFIEFFAISTDSEASRRLLDHAVTQGADVVYKDPKTGELYRPSAKLAVRNSTSAAE